VESGTCDNEFVLRTYGPAQNVISCAMELSYVNVTLLSCFTGRSWNTMLLYLTI